MKREIIFWISVAMFFGGIIGGGMYGFPQYSVYQNNLAGLAELKKAESNRQIKTLEAKAAEESAKYLAQAEIVRAEGVAKANRIIGDSLKGNEAYLHYLWIHNLEVAGDNGSQIIYIPTEAGMPVMEAGKRK